MTAVLDEGPFYHGTRAALEPGDLLSAGFNSNYKPEALQGWLERIAALRADERAEIIN